MISTFTPKLPDKSYSKPILISGIESLQFSIEEFLLVQQNGDETIFEIRYDCHCSPFKEAILLNKLLIVGHEEYFYMFDMSRNLNILRLKTPGYFGHIYFDTEHFYVAGSSSLYCVNQNGEVVWQNLNLAIDGVIINDFTDNKIFGSGEWDPPGGWRDFVLEKRSGLRIQ